MRPARALVLAAALPWLSACESPGGNLLSDDDDDATGPVGEQELDWELCPLVPGQDTNQAECATAQLPLDYDQPDAEQISVLVKRLPADGDETGQLWLMHGGPGGSAIDDLVGLAHGLPDLRADLSYYAIDHRGIGGTARLDCPEQEAPDSPAGVRVSDEEMPDCLEAFEADWGAGLDQINTSNSARDAGTLMQRLAGDGELFVWGGSYGTYLGQRFMQLFPELPDGVILEGISAPGQGFVGYEAGMDDAGRALMEACGDDASCTSHFDGSPWDVAVEMVDSIDDGHCPELGTTTGFIRTFLASLLFYDGLRDLVPALVFRLDRCSTEDVQAVVSTYNRIFPSGGSPLGMANDGLSRSDALFFHVALSEMWDLDVAPDLDEAAEAFGGLTMSTGLEIRLAKMVDADIWPTFPLDQHHGRFSDYQGPLLMLQGGLDPATNLPHAQPVGEHYDGPAQTWVEFPWGAHNITGATPLPNGDDCALRLYLDFLEAPDEELDLGCVDEALPPQFDGYPGYAEWLFGTVDAWGD